MGNGGRGSGGGGWDGAAEGYKRGKEGQPEGQTALMRFEGGVAAAESRQAACNPELMIQNLQPTAISD